MADRSAQSSDQMIRDAKELLLRGSTSRAAPPFADDSMPLDSAPQAAPVASPHTPAPQPIPQRRSRAPQRRTRRPRKPSVPEPEGGGPSPASRRTAIVAAALVATLVTAVGVALFAAGLEPVEPIVPPPATVAVTETTASPEPVPTPAAAPVSTEAPTAPQVELRLVEGSLSVMGAENVTRVGIGGCVGAGDYSAVVEGAVVTVRDDGGADLAHGVLATGRRESLSGVTTGCRLAFSVELPEDRRAYVFEVGPISRSMSRSDLMSVDWHPDIRIDR